MALNIQRLMYAFEVLRTVLLNFRTTLSTTVKQELQEAHLMLQIQCHFDIPVYFANMSY